MRWLGRKPAWWTCVSALVAVGLILATLAGLTVYGFLRDDEQVRSESASKILIGPPEEIIPALAPPSAPRERSNNNLDAVRFDGRYYLAYRTAPFHYASDKAHIVVISSSDRRTWRQELLLSLPQRDLREPRLLVHRGRLILFFLESDDKMFGFSPFYTHVSFRNSDGSWTAPQIVLPRGIVLWRARSYGDTVYAAGYDGTRIYNVPGIAGGLLFLTSSDGVHWEAKRPIAWQGAAECDFDIDDAGNITAVVRREGRDGLLCIADAAHSAEWSCHEERYKYDSPLMFRDKGRLFLLARRSLGGTIAEPAYLPGWLKFRMNVLVYWFTRKRTALYEISADRRRIEWIADFPSRGDTAYPALAPLAPGHYWVLTYSNDLRGPDLPWFWGQFLVQTKIYGYEMEIDL